MKKKLHFKQEGNKNIFETAEGARAWSGLFFIIH